jgi:hypothetical protein
MKPQFLARHAAALTLGAGLAVAGCGSSDPDEPVAGEVIASSGSVAAQPSSGAVQMFPEARPRDELAEIRRELAALRTDLHNMQQRLNRTHTAAPGDAPTTQVLQPVQMDGERLTRNESAFRVEAADPQWSRNAALQIQSAIAQVGNGAAEQVRGLDCRSKTCRVELAPNDHQPAYETLIRISQALGNVFTRAEFAHLRQSDGSIAGVLFLVR